MAGRGRIPPDPLRRIEMTRGALWSKLGAVSKPINPLRVVRDVIREAKASEDSRHQRITGAGLDPRMAQLRAWQCARIAKTYADFAAQPQYAPALEFFLADLYAPRDFSQRDHDAERAYTFLRRIVPAEMLKLVADSRELVYLSYSLDQALLAVLVQELGLRGPVTEARYAEAYRRCNNGPARERQIALSLRVLRDAVDTARFPLSRPAMRLVRGPAHKAGWHELYGFLERGLDAFGKVKHPERLLEAIRARETRIMRQLMAGASHPFRLN